MAGQVGFGNCQFPVLTSPTPQAGHNATTAGRSGNDIPPYKQQSACQHCLTTPLITHLRPTAALLSCPRPSCKTCKDLFSTPLPQACSLQTEIFLSLCRYGCSATEQLRSCTHCQSLQPARCSLQSPALCAEQAQAASQAKRCVSCHSHKPASCRFRSPLIVCSLSEVVDPDCSNSIPHACTFQRVGPPPLCTGIMRLWI